MARSFASLANKQLQTSTGKSDARRKLIGAVHAAAKRWGKDEDERRDIQLAVTGKSSLKDMTLPEIGRVLDRLNADRPDQGLANNTRPHVGKIRALWWTLYWLGEVDSPNDTALDGFINRQTGISSLRFLDPRRAPAVIEALKSRVSRGGVLPVDPKLSTSGDLERHAVISALWNKLVEAAVVKQGSKGQYLRAACALGDDAAKWTNRELDECIKLLGKAYRSHLAKLEKQAGNNGDGYDR